MKPRSAHRNCPRLEELVYLRQNGRESITEGSYILEREP